MRNTSTDNPTGASIDHIRTEDYLDLIFIFKSDVGGAQ
jgi:hypothetical protein